MPFSLRRAGTRSQAVAFDDFARVAVHRAGLKLRGNAGVLVGNLTAGVVQDISVRLRFGMPLRFCTTLRAWRRQMFVTTDGWLKEPVQTTDFVIEE